MDAVVDRVAALQRAVLKNARLTTGYRSAATIGASTQMQSALEHFRSDGIEGDSVWLATGASTKMTRLYGRCPRGERLVAPVPWGHWKTTTFVGALRQDGLIAPCAFDGPINGETFRAWAEQFLVPELKPGDIVILDNLSSHKVEGVRTAIENAGARLLYLPAYSPDLNPIEQWFAKLKALLRKAAARTFDALIRAIASALETFTPDECANYLANSGYRRQ